MKNSYQSPIIFAEITALIYIIIAACYLQIDIILSVTCAMLCVLCICAQIWLYGIRAIIACIITAYACLLLMSHLYLLHIISINSLYIILPLYLVFHTVYCISAYDAYMDTYIFEQLVGKLFCWPKYSCYRLSIQLDNASYCYSKDLGIIWNNRYCYTQLDDICKDLILVEDDIRIHASVINKVYKYW